MAASASFSADGGDRAMQLGPGRVTLIVGPSGAGKDAILQAVREHLAQDHRFVFPRRIVTRTATSAEDHDTVSPDAFDALLREGALALHWQAHDLSYGISSCIDDAVRSGNTVVFNASRQAVAAAKARYACSVVLIDAPPDVRARRLANRSRERPEAVAARLQRVVADFKARDIDLVINNTGTLDDASRRLTEWLLTRI